MGVRMVDALSCRYRPAMRPSCTWAGMAALALVSGTGHGSAPRPIECAQQADTDSALECGRCHQDNHREWSQGAHAKAWTDPVYQKALLGKPRPDLCHGCHIPQEVQRRLGKPPQPRQARLADGVDCVACHRRAGAILGPFGAKTTAHETMQDPTFAAPGSNALCAACHSTKIGPVLPVARDFEERGLAEQGKSCTGCHMPKVDRVIAIDPVTSRPSGPLRSGREHQVLGPGDAAFCAKAFEITLRRDGDECILAIANKAGHRVPGLTARKFVVRARQLGDDDREIKKEPAFEITAENELRVMETREVRFLLAARATKVEVAVDHSLFGKTVATILQRVLQP